ncbi:eCIS core domain-containing protein, partial [Ideonella dechloratans]|uniref:eCIS core domain-containing protein n=1 Tax=Ideonella dechloratans TaxID=36863 RepID=UPI0035B3462B
PKLRLGHAQDEAEHQADRMAARALGLAGPVALPAGDAQAQRCALRQVLGHGPRPAAGQTGRPAADPAVPQDEDTALPEALERELHALQAGGQPLPPPLRAEMETRFGMDLSGVRLHTGARAARLNQALGAHAFALGEHIAFDNGRFQPGEPAGRFLLAHELAHVAQQRGAGEAPSGTAAHAPATVRGGFWGDLYDSVSDTLGDIANWAIDKVRELGWRLLESISPEFARTVRAIVDEGLLHWLGRQVARAWDGFIGGLRTLVPFEGPRQLITLFDGLVRRAAGIAAALVAGRCEPLMAAIGELKTFVTEAVGVAWDKLSAFLRPIGEFFSRLWADFGAPALQWLQNFGGSVWEGIQSLGRRLWDWIRPVREAAARVWNWFSELLFGPATGDETTGSSGGVVGWLSAKAGEAWDWVRERTRPVWQPVAALAERVAALIPPAFVRQMGERAQQLAGGLDSASAGMEGGDGVPAARQSLASVLPGIQTVLTALRGLIQGAGAWLGERIGGVATLISGLVGRLQASEWLSWLASAFGWLTEALDTLLAWAREQVAALFAGLLRGFDALTPFVALVLETVRKLITVAGDLMQLPLLILGGLWRRVPACIREPIERFIQEQVLARIPVFGQFFSDPELWPRVQATALGILRRIFVDGDLAGAAWAFFQAVLRVLGLPAQLVVQVLAKAARAIGDILTNPIGFLLNLLRAAKAGFLLFFSNIGTHLLGGVTGWLFGQLQEAGIRPPADFSLRSILGFVLEVLGLTVENIFRRLAERVGPEVVARLRRMLDLATGVWRFVSVLATEGVAGLWRELQERLSGLWDQVLQGVSGWITGVVIARAQRWLTALLDPTGIMAVVNSLVALYNAIESFFQYLREMLEIVSRVLDGVLDIARGSIDTAAGFLENALGRAMPVAIGFLAHQLGLDGLGRRIAEMLGRVQTRVNAAIDWLIERALRAGRAVLDLARRGASA